MNGFNRKRLARFNLAKRTQMLIDRKDLGIGVSAWNNNGNTLDANGFHTYSQTFNAPEEVICVGRC